MLKKDNTKRRWLLTGAVAGSAGLAGAWWRNRQGPEGRVLGEAASSTAAPGTPGSSDIWQSSFPQPGGGPPLVLAALRGRPLVINFWATWCPPCLREMPALGRFKREFANQNWQVVGLAVDQEKPVLAYLAQHPAGYPIALAGLQGVDLSRAWGNSSGGLPFTVVLDKMGQVAHTHLGEASYAQMAAWANGR
jgi:thiol-disulfide isomerase/thioredoxin